MWNHVKIMSCRATVSYFSIDVQTGKVYNNV